MAAAASLSNFRLIKSHEITTREFFSLVDVTDNQRLIDVLEGVPFLGYPVRIAAVSQSHAPLRIPFPETRDQYTETDPIIAPPDQNRDMGVFINEHRVFICNEYNKVNNNENNNEDNDESVITVIPTSLTTPDSGVVKESSL